MADWLDRTYVSRYGGATFGVIVHRGGAEADADSDEVLASLLDAEAVPVFTDRLATRTAPGRYQVALTSDDTATPGLYTLGFDYQVDASPFSYVFDIEVGPTAPAYDALPEGWQQVVENVWVRLADLFDSPAGGPHLATYVQTRFGRNRLAQLLRQAVGRLNTIAQPHSTYAVTSDFPFDTWGPLVEQALYVEVVKHLIRSYVEQPEVVLGVSVSRTDRRDYMNRWEQVLATEQPDLDRMMAHFKQSNMGLGNVSVLVAGGAFGNFGPTVNPAGGGAAAARGYYFVRRHH